MVYSIVLSLIILSLFYIFLNYRGIKKLPEGNSEMVEMAGIIRDGATTFLRTEFKMIVAVVLFIALIFSLLIEKLSGITLILGALMSSLVCIIGMKSATYANVRTANRAKETLSVGETVKVALKGGSISGLSVQAFGLLGFVIVIILNNLFKSDVSTGLLLNIECNPLIMRVTTYSLGCSLVAMFNRVAGGNYTKAADISSDILAKIRHDMPEDDARVPNVIADFIGDNVNDIAGNCSDLLESFVATMSAVMIISLSVFVEISEILFLLPVIIGGIGLLGCLIGLWYASIKKMSDNPSKELDLSTWVSAGITLVGVTCVCYMLFSTQNFDMFAIGWFSPVLSILLGIISGIAIGKLTEYYTSADYKPTKELAGLSVEGEAFVVTKGDAIGSKSCLWPILIIGVALLVSGKIKYQLIAIGSNSMKPIFSKGDAILIEYLDSNEIKKLDIGDIIVYYSDNKIIVHRIIEKEKLDNDNYMFKTKGDNNKSADYGYVEEDQIIAKYKLDIPIIGYPTIWVREILFK